MMEEKGISKFTSNGTQGGRSTNHDGEFDDEVQDCEIPVDKELQADLDRTNSSEVGSVSQEDLAAESPQEVWKEKNENHSTDHDQKPELSALRAAQEALEREVQKFKEIDEEDFINCQLVQEVGLPSEFTSGGGDFSGPSTSEQSQSGDGVQHSFGSESEVVRLKQNVVLLQNNLNQAAELVKIKEARVTELQSILRSAIHQLNCNPSELQSISKKEEESAGIPPGDTESEIEGLFKQKIEAEVEYLTISRAVEKLKVAVVEQVTLLEEQKKLASEQAQIVKKLGYTKSKAATLKTQAKKLENCCEDIMSSDEMQMLQKRVCKYSTLFFVQLVLLVALGLFLLETSPDYVEVAT